MSVSLNRSTPYDKTSTCQPPRVWRQPQNIGGSSVQYGTGEGDYEGKDDIEHEKLTLARDSPLVSMRV